MYDLIPMKIAASGMSVQRARMGVVASNLANANSTRNADGTGGYERRMMVVRATRLPSFEKMLERHLAGQSREIRDAAPGRESRQLIEQHFRGVAISRIERDPAVRRVPDPNHPDADAQGYVTYPDISVIQEMTDMISASRQYEANLAVVKSTRDMIMQTLEILKS